MKHCNLIKERSPCIRGKVGAFIIDSNDNPVSAGYNGTPRRAPGDYCGLNACLRDNQKIKSGESIEIGCLHAEQNSICNAAKKGISLDNCTIIISTYPCLSCAKYIHHSGISLVAVPKCSYYSLAGVHYLIENGVEVKFITAEST
tara:strand:- start:1031 stop:1465 length:435 start_codon:yes stop_codon:yes gene_type:complete